MIAKVSRRSTLARAIAPGTGATMMSMLACLAIIFLVAIFLVIFVVVAMLLAVTFVPAAPTGVERLACRVTFFIAQLAVAIFVHAAEHRLANFIARRAMVPTSVRRWTRMVGAAMRRSESMRATTVSKTPMWAGAVWSTVRATAMSESVFVMRAPTVMSRSPMMPSVMRMMPTAITATVVTGMFAVVAIAFGCVSRRFHFLPHRGPLVIA